MAARKTSLTPKRLAFVREYVKDLNGTQAAIRAGYSANRANDTAYKTLKCPLVQAEVQRRIQRLSVKADVTADRVLRELARIAFADTTTAVRVVTYRVRGVDRTEVIVSPTDSLTPDQRAAIAEVAETENGIRVKLHDKPKALELLGKYLALFTDRTEISGNPDAPLVVVGPPPPA